ncbi:Prolyl endopeptidase precursor [Corynebacterium ciconiae DSM 44920]|uniref:prolyl oligopeptidase family serine peptidase n=1 Tax=Corynebacterium ciconiae TaxID=227319 RepID=UPI0003729CA3|nr:prolyl oligopeptidase family serine peptidase [Corynebacterium ciconiae]WKD62153.1 Prolyl endopeptidase precursor [Corynebacterium ciconiae DSM 44920]
MSITAPASTPSASELAIIESPTALAWAQEWTTSTIEQIDSRAGGRSALQRKLRAALDTDARVPYVTRRGEYLYNFWRDSDHPRGLWRRTSYESYLSEAPEWEILLDVDALAAEDGHSWVWKGAHVREPECDRALVRLSRGGGDATVIREFDITTASFVEDRPFELPEDKSDVSWESLDTVILGTNVGEGSLTESGYPARVYRWHRGTDPREAELLFSGERSDIASGGWADRTPGFERVLIERRLDMFTAENYLLRESTPVRIDVPIDCEIIVHRSQIFLLPRTEFHGVPAGGVGVADFDSYMQDPAAAHVQVIFSPTEHQSLETVHFTRSYGLIQVLDNVSTTLYRVRLDAPEDCVRLKIPELASTSVVATSPMSEDPDIGEEVWLYSSSFTTPDSLLRADARYPDTFSTVVKRAPEQFDTSEMSTRQYWATSADGTRIPYFVTGRLDEEADPSPKPCMVHAYGGFEVALVPSYSAVTGIAWLAKGHLFVQANLRGGSEFGPQWHSQATKLQRRKVFEDHQAVLRDLVDRGLTTREQLAVRGGSNGGLLTAVALTSYPELVGAVVSEVPLIDMLRYHTLLAGASWVAEYGHPDIPEERAVIESYSPLQRVVPNDETAYPPALVTTSTRDDRVHPAHARWFAAALAAAGQPVDYVENSEGGHAGAADNDQIAWKQAIVYSWLEQQLGCAEAAGTADTDAAGASNAARHAARDAATDS